MTYNNCSLHEIHPRSKRFKQFLTANINLFLDKKAFFNDQCKEIEEKNRMGKTRGLFKKIRDTKGTFFY